MIVLIVEDDATQRRAVERLVREAGHEVYWAIHYDGAVHKLEYEPIDVLLLDVMLGDTLDGLRVAAIARRKKIPTIITSGLDRELVFEAARANLLDGVDLWIQKPIEWKVLARALASIEATLKK